MSKRSNIALIIVMIATITNSCREDALLGEDHFFVNNDGASMPVYVRGNLDANAMVVFLHGGPGGNASQATYVPSFREIEASYAIAYWDQRASGLSQGNPDTSSFTIAQFVEDLDYVLQALRDRYPGKQLFLLGHSWGGALGAAYLSTGDFQLNIAGFICMNSGHNLIDGLPLSVDWVGTYAEEQVSMGNRVDYWKEIAVWCAADPDMTVPDNYFEYVTYLRETDAYRHENQEVIINNPGLGDITNSRLSLAILFGGQFLAQNFNILELNLSDDMQRIQIPSLVVWGRHDGVNTIDMGFDAMNSLGTDSTQKTMVILENSAHEGYVEEPELFREAVIEFIDLYK